MTATNVQQRPNDAWETTHKHGLFRRLTLRRADGRVYLNRWALTVDRLGGVKLHRMDAPDPGVDLHDHPWWFVSIVLRGGYVEERADIRHASQRAEMAKRLGNAIGGRGDVVEHRPGRFHVMRLDECHRIFHLTRTPTWTLVISGPRRRLWGFYLPDGYLDERRYDETVRADRRDLWSDHNEARPW